MTRHNGTVTVNDKQRGTAYNGQRLKIKALRALVGRFSLSISWENGP